MGTKKSKNSTPKITESSYFQTINAPRFVFFAFALVFIGFSFFKVQHLKQLPNYDSKDDTALFWTESAFQYRYAKIVADTGTIPEADAAAQFPEGARPHKEFTLFMEYTAGYLYRVLWGDNKAVPFHVFLIYFISIFSSLTLLAVYLLGRTLWESPLSGLVSVLFYLTARISWARTIAGFNYEDFALPLIFLGLALFMKAIKVGCEKKLRYLYSTLSAIFVYAALNSWHYSRFYFLVLSVIVGISFFVNYDDDGALHIPISAIFLAGVIGGLFSPVLKASNFLFSFPMLLWSALFVAVAFKERFGVPRTKAFFAFLTVFLITGSVSFLSKSDVGEYFHVYSLFLYKLKYLFAKPDNPLLLPFDTRILWIEGFDSPTVYDWISRLSLLLPLGLIPLVFEMRDVSKKPAHSTLIFGGLALAFISLALFVIRQISFSAIFLAVYVGKYPGMLCRYPIAARKIIYGTLLSVLLLTPLSYFLIAKYQPKLDAPPTINTSDSKHIVTWIRANTKPQDVVLSDISMGAFILAYTGRAVNLQPKFENAYIRGKVEKFAYALYSTEDDFYKLCREYGATYFVYQNSFVFSHSKESYRYYSNNLKLSKKSAAYKFNFEPDKLAYFNLVYQTNSYRIYRVLPPETKVPRKNLDLVASYNPIYDPKVFGAASADDLFDDDAVPAAFSKILSQVELMGKGLSEMNAGHYVVAKEYMLKSVAELPNPLIHFQLGNVNYFLGDYAAAIADYAASLNYAAEAKPEVLNNMSAAYYQIKDYAKAEEYRRKSVEVAGIIRKE